MNLVLATVQFYTNFCFANNISQNWCEEYNLNIYRYSCITLYTKFVICMCAKME